MTDIFANDSYIATPGTNLSVYTSAEGGTYSIQGGSNNFIISPSGSLYVDGNGVSQCSYSKIPTQTVLLAEGTFVMLSAIGEFVGIELQDSFTNRYYVYLYDGNGGSGGVNGNRNNTTIGGGGYSFTPTVGVPFTLGISITNGLIQGFLNGTLAFTFQDPSPITISSIGVLMQNAAASPTTGTHLTNLTGIYNPVSGKLSVSNTIAGTIQLAMTAEAGGTSPYSLAYTRGLDGVTFGTTLATHTGVTGADSYNDTSASVGTSYYYQVNGTDAFSRTFSSNIFGPVNIFQKYSAPPSNPQLDLSGPMASTLQSLVVTNTGAGTGIPRNIVANNLPYRNMGMRFMNGGEDPLWVASDFTPNTTPTPALRFSTNAKSLCYPYGGVGGTTSRTSINTVDRTYFAIFKMMSIDPTIFPSVPIMGMSTMYEGQSLPGCEGMGIAAVGNLGYLCWYTSSAINNQLVSCDNGGNFQCPVIAGHWYIAAISISDAVEAYTRFFLYDLTVGAEISAQGDQYTVLFNNTSLSDVNSRHLISPFAGNGAGDFFLHMDAGATVHLLLAGMDNQTWGNGAGVGPATPSGYTYSIFNTLVANPYFPLTTTVNTGGIGVTTLFNPTGGTFPGDTIYVPSSSTHGQPANLPFVCYGDFNITAVNHLTMTLQCTPPVGAPHAISTYTWYSSASYGSNGSVIGTTSVPYFVWTPGDTARHYLTVVATDSVSTNYIYAQYACACRSRATVKFLLAGNSIYQIGNPFAIQQALTSISEAQGFDMFIAIQGITGSLISDYTTGSSTTKGFYGINGGTLNAMNWSLITAAAELAYTGAGIDCIAWQLAGNSTSISTGQYTDVATESLTGTGVDGTSYGIAIAVVNFAQAPSQHGGHSYTDSAASIANQANAIAVSNGTTIIATGAIPSLGTQVFQLQMAGGHPDAFVAAMEAFSLLNEFPPLIPAAVATSYLIAGIPSNPVVGTSYTVIAALNGDASASGVITFGAQTGITWGGTISIAQGDSSGTTTVTFTAPGSYTPTVTHTGLGISGDPTLSSVSASSSGGGGSGAIVGITMIGGITG